MSERPLVRKVAFAALVAANIGLAAALATPAEASAAFGCALGPEECACIAVVEICSHVKPLSDVPCNYQSECHISY